MTGFGHQPTFTGVRKISTLVPDGHNGCPRQDTIAGASQFGTELRNFEAPAGGTPAAIVRAMELLQRQDWVGSASDLGLFFRMQRNGRRAVCRLLTHRHGWQLKLSVDGARSLDQRAICSTDEEVFSTAAEWMKGLRRKGWI